MGGHLQAEHTPSKEQASGEGLGQGTASHHHPAPSTLRVVVVADSRKLDVSPSKSRYVLVQGPHVPLPQEFEALHLLKMQQNYYNYNYFYSTCSSLSLLSSTQLSRASLTEVTRVFTECDPQLRQLFARLLLCGYLITSLHWFSYS